MVKRKPTTIRNNASNFRQPKIYSGRIERPKEKSSIDWSFITGKRIFFFVLILLAGWWLFFSGSFRVREIIVEGNKLIAAEEIGKFAPLDRNIFFVQNAKIEKNIKSNIPEVESVQIYKGLPDALKVVLAEYDQSLVWKVGEKYYLVDSQGRAYKDITATKDQFTALPLIDDTKSINFALGDKIVSGSFISFTNNIFQKVAETANLHPDHFSVSETTFDLNLYVKEGFYIKFDTSRSSKKQLDDLKTVMASKGGEIHEYLDLRVNGWAYYK